MVRWEMKVKVGDDGWVSAGLGEPDRVERLIMVTVGGGKSWHAVYLTPAEARLLRRHLSRAIHEMEGREGDDVR